MNPDGSLSGETDINTSLPINATISLACTDSLILNSITGTGNSTLDANNEATCTVITNNSQGYRLEWQTASTDMTNDNSDSIASYQPTVANTPENWSIDQATSAWGARLKFQGSTDQDETTWGNQDDYANGKWLNITNSNFPIITRTSETDPAGSDQIIQFGAQIGSNKFQPTGTYTTNVVMTATTL